VVLLSIEFKVRENSFKLQQKFKLGILSSPTEKKGYVIAGEPLCIAKP
jgi:hypothetical protein